MPETPFFDQGAPAAARGRTTPDRLDGTVALVTGASSGIGAATAITLAAEGAAVAVAARRKDWLEDVASGIRGQGGTVLVLESDITDEQQATDAVGRTVAGWAGGTADPPGASARGLGPWRRPEGSAHGEDDHHRQQDQQPDHDRSGNRPGTPAGVLRSRVMLAAQWLPLR